MVSLHGTQPEGGTQLLTVKKAKDDNDKSLGSSPIVHPAHGGGGGGFYHAYPGARAPGPIRRIHGQYRFNPTSGSPIPTASSQGSVAQGGYILFVYNIGPEADESLLYSLFSPFGAVAKVNVIKEGATGKGKGYGFVTMANHEEASIAISQLDGYMMGGKPLQVSFKK